MKLSTSKWVSKAEAELQGATTMRNGTEPLHDLVCFHAQQSAEKCDNAVLVERSTLFPKTHDWTLLADLPKPPIEAVDLMRCDLDELLRLAIQERSLGFSADTAKSDRACEVASIVRVICRNVLSLASEED